MCNDLTCLPEIVCFSNRPSRVHPALCPDKTLAGQQHVENNTSTYWRRTRERTCIRVLLWELVQFEQGVKDSRENVDAWWCLCLIRSLVVLQSWQSPAYCIEICLLGKVAKVWFLSSSGRALLSPTSKRLLLVRGTLNPLPIIVVGKV